jgi:pyruvate dehydrogenase E1 component
VPDIDPSETKEWLDAFDDVVDQIGPDRAQYLLTRLSRHAAAQGLNTPDQVTTPYHNSIPVHLQPP